MFDGVLEQFGLKQYDYLDCIIKSASKNISDTDFYRLELKAWLQSPKRKQMLKALEYYKYEYHLPTEQVPWSTDADGAPIYREKNPGKLIDNQYAYLVDQKVDYFLSKPFAIRTENDTYTEWLQKVMDASFRNILTDAARYSIQQGIAWLHPFFDDEGRLQFEYFPGHEVLPFWADKAHTKLDLAIHYYLTFKYEGEELKAVPHVDVYDKDRIQQYVMENGELIQERGTETKYYGLDSAGKPFSWGRIPLIALKYNSFEMPLLNRIETLQNAFNGNLSNWDTSMGEQVRDCIMVLKNYGGESIAEFKDLLEKYGAVKVRDDGGLELLRIERDPESYKAYRSVLKKAIIENGRGFDAKDDRVGTNPNEMNLKSMYADIELDTNIMESQYQYAFINIKWFVDKYLEMSGAGSFQDTRVIITFDRSTLVNEVDVVNNIKTSQGIVSNETLLAHHPYVYDVKTELARVKREKEEEMQQMVDYSALEAEAKGEGTAGDSG